MILHCMFQEVIKIKLYLILIYLEVFVLLYLHSIKIVYTFAPIQCSLTIHGSIFTSYAHL